MAIREVVIPLPESLYHRLQQTAQATQQSLTDVLLHAVKVGSPPDWSDAPAEFQGDLAILDRLPDDALWQLAQAHYGADMGRHQALLDKNAEGSLSAAESAELSELREHADRFMLRKAHAAALLRWRGQHLLP